MRSIPQNFFRVRFKGVFSLLVLNYLLFFLINVLQLPFSHLFLNHQNVRWYQFVTSLFCHADFAHLSGNMFFLYIFGKMIEEEERAWGLFCAFLICGIGANLFHFLFSGLQGVSLGASGAVFGLFTVAMLVKFKLNFFNILEILVITPFILKYLGQEIALMNRSDSIAHDAHLYGAGVGVLLIMGLFYLEKNHHH